MANEELKAIDQLGKKMDEFSKIQTESNIKLEVLSSKFEMLDARGTRKGEERAEDLYGKIAEIAKSQNYTKAFIALVTITVGIALTKMGFK